MKVPKDVLSIVARIVLLVR